MHQKVDFKSDECRYVVEHYNHAVVHLRQQLSNGQFGLVFGAGIGKDLGFPKWKDLLERIANHSEVSGQYIFDGSGSETSKAQFLFQHYKNRCIENAAEDDKKRNMLEMKVRAGWRNIVRTCLYQNLPSDLNDLLKKDRYLESLVPLMKRSPLTVTYNFDDTLQKLLKKHSDEDERGSATYWSGNVQLLPRKGAVIYHPNGFLPSKASEKPSDQLVLLEDSFIDQVIDSSAGHYASLASHISKTTCLFIGLSLDDPGLKHLLRQNAKAFPGQFHYFVRFVHDPSKVNRDIQKVEAEANFDVYNLITLHLTAQQIRGLADLLAAKQTDFSAAAEELVDQHVFRYYLVGSVSAGKSTTASYFRSLLTQEEWAEERAPGMEKAPDMLTREETEMIDAWVAKQVSIKNRKLLDGSKFGVHVIDRAPLDAFAFTLDDQSWKSKAAKLELEIRGDKARRTIQSGQVIFLNGDPDVMAERAVSLHKVTSAEKLGKQQHDLRLVYSGLIPSGSFTEIDTRGKTANEVVKLVAKLIFQTPYVAADLDARLIEFKENGRPKDE